MKSYITTSTDRHSAAISVSGREKSAGTFFAGVAQRVALAVTMFFLMATSLSAQSLLIDVSVSNTSPSASDVITYKVRYRCASITNHCFNSHITFTLPDAYDIISTPGTGGNVAGVTMTGNAVDISLVSPPSAGAPAGALAAGASGILETKVRFKCGTNGVAPVPAAGTTVNFTVLPTFTVTGGSQVAAAPPAVTVPTVSACAVIPPPAPLTSPLKTIEGSSAKTMSPGESSFYAIAMPTLAAGDTWQITDDIPDGMLVWNVNYTPNEAVDIFAAGQWYRIPSQWQTWAGSVAIGAQLSATRLSDNMVVPVPGVFHQAQYIATGVDQIRVTVSGPRASSQVSTNNSIYVSFTIASDAIPGPRINCLTSNNPSWVNSCAPTVYVTEKPVIQAYLYSENYFYLGTSSLTSAIAGQNWYVQSGNPNLYKDPMDAIIYTPISCFNLQGGGLIYEQILPVGFEYSTDPTRPNFWWELKNNPASCSNPTFTSIPNYNGTGQTLLRWEYPACSGLIDVRLNFSFRYTGTTPLPNPLVVPPGTVRMYNGAQFVVAPSAPPICATERPTGQYSLAKPVTGGDVNSIKWVKGALDASFSRYPLTGNTNLNGDGNYEIYISCADWKNVKQLDVADILPYIGDQGMLTAGARGSAWSEELAAAITVQRYKIGTGLVNASADLPFGVMYTTAANPCYLDAAQPTGQVKADVALANFGMGGACTDFSGATPAASAKGFLFRWSNAADPLVFGEYLKLTIPVRQLTGEADNLSGGISWNSVAYTATESDNSELLSSEPLKVGLKMIDPSTTAAIGDYVWLDGNANGRQDAGETPIAGVVVSLYDAAGQPVTQPVVIGGVTTQVPVTAITDGNGYYCFPGLTPNTNYSVRLESTTNFGNGGNLSTYSLTTPNAVADDVDSDASLGTLAGSPVTPRPQILAPTGAGGTQTKTYDFGFICLGSVSGYAWMDTDKEGDQDNSEMALSGITVTLRDAATNAAVGASVMTNASGNFTLGSVPAGTYYIEFTTFPGAKIPTYKDLTGNDNTDSDVNANGRTDVFSITPCGFLKFDLGLRDAPANPASICGTAWEDLDKDGTFDASEPGLPNVTVQLLSTTGFVLNTTTTNATGDYCFTNLDPNVGYQVAFVPPAVGIMFSAAGPDQDVNLTTGVTTATYTPTNNQTINDVDAGFMGPLSLGNQVWSDVNNNGLFDNGEPTFSGVTVRLIGPDATTVLATTTTDGNGRYLFKNLMAGAYFVEAAVPSGYRSSTDVGTTNNPNGLDSDDNGVGGPSSGYVWSKVIVLENTGGTAGSANWTETDNGVSIMGMIDPAINQKAYYTVDFGFYLQPPCPASITFCPGESYTLTADAGWSNYKWYYDADGAGPGAPVQIAGANTNVYATANQAGYYTWTADDANGCPIAACCPIILVAGVNCPIDYGDLPDSGPGTGSGNYETTVASGGPSHGIVVGFKIGTLVDSETNGFPGANANGDDTDGSDDEDGFTVLPMFVAGQTTTVNIPVMNPTASNAKLVAFIDFDGDGDFGGVNSATDEMVSATVLANTNPTVTLNIPVPVNAVLNTNIGLRLRLSNDPTFIANMSPNGAVSTGEVEDYIVQVMGYDWGDLADGNTATNGAGNYATQNDGTTSGGPNDGPSHKIVAGLKLGATVDAEGDGQQSTLATGDDSTTAPGTDDENGVTLPNFVAGVPSDITVNVMNMMTPGAAAKLFVFIDWNNDGDFNDASEAVPVVNVPDLTNGNLNVTVTPPVASVPNVNLGVRVRLSTDMAAMSPNGEATNGEVEDYVAQVKSYDYGDLPDSGPGTGPGNYETTVASGGPSHGIDTNIKIGVSIDAEGNGAPSATANGDDLATSDDEDGFTVLPMFVAGQTTPLTIPVMNMTGVNTAKLVVFIDFDNDGVFGPTEMFSASNVGNVASVNINVPVPVNAVLNTNVGLRLRFSTDPTFVTNMSPNGPAADGEVEDYVVQIMGYDWGDLADGNTASNGAGNYATQNDNTTPGGVNDGPSHKIVTGLKLGASVDAESDGQQSTLATGDDSTTAPGTDDENGVTLPSFVPGVPANITVNVMNMMTPGAAAKLFVFIDWNNDGTFDDAGEAIPVVNVPDLTNGNINVSVTPPVNTVLNADLGVRVRLSTDMAAMSPNGNATDGEVEDYTTKVQVVDYGDHPNTYGTTGPNAPRHTADPNLKLGTRLDGETDGQPDAMAGAMTGGDDNTNGVVVAGTAGDDEDGVMLVSPLIPGSTATIMVDAMNMTGSNAVLQGWIDWNGNGMFDMVPNEELTFTNLGGGTVPSPAGLVGAKLTFVVPANATFASGNAFMRFRLSPSGGLLPGSQTAPAPIGEIEDYKTSLGKLGNLVFNDQNFNGLQDAGEAGINGVTVTLTWAGPNNVIDGGGDDVTYPALTTGTGFDQGEYYFCGITNGTYKIKYTTPTNMTPTRNNQGSQVNGGTKDSDGSLTGMDLTMAMETFTIADVTALPTTEDGNGDNGTTPTGSFPDAQTDETHDQGFALLDYGDLPQNPPGDDFNTTMAEGGAVHVVNSNLKLGATVDGERDGTPSNTANGDDASNTGSADDEDGIVFATPLIPGNSATITVSAMNMTGGDAVLQGWIDWNNDGVLSNLEQLTFTSPAGGVITSPAGASNAAFTFNVPANAIFNDGMVFARFRLSPIGSGLSADGPDKFNPATTVPQGEVEDYKLNVAKVGNYVWEDRNFDGLQGTSVAEPPLNGVSVQLVWLGADGAVGGAGANADVSYTALTTGSAGFQPGQYYYCGLTPGTYKLVYGTPTNMTPTPANQGSQTNGGVLDSDGSINGTMAMETFTIPADVTTLPTAENGRTDNGTAGVGTFPDNQADETHDQGFALLDYGDLPDSGPGVSAGNYETQSGNNGAFHVIVPNLKIGNAVDAETNGNQSPLASGDDASNTGSADDEDGFDPSLAANMLIAGQTTSVSIPVMNMTGSNAKMVAFIDFDGDGDFNGVNSATDEMVSVSNIGNVASVTLNIPVPANSLLNTNVGMRIRFSTDANFATNMSANGLASDGEVEDYVVQIMGYDWGDLADGNTATNGAGNYATQNDAANPGSANDGPSHKIVTGLKMGTSVDAEANGQQSLTANGDDSTTPPGTDDENGVTFPTFTAGLSSNITVNVMNSTGNPAKLFAFIDWNNDGDFADLSEAVPVVNVPSGTNGNLTVTVTPPLGFTMGIPNTALNVPLGARFRLSTDMAAMSPVGNASDGEVEDYQIVVAGYDWGDLNDTGAGTGTAPNGTPANYNTNDANAPSHKILTDPTGAVTLKIGASVDDEATGQPSTTAGRLSGGDDAVNLSDEDGLSYATMPPFIITQTTNLTIPVMNMTGSTAKLTVFVDFNKDGDFLDMGESFSPAALIPSAAGVFNATVAIAVPAPPTAAVGEYVGLRIRLANDAMEAMSPTGLANSGEVEDYEVQLVGFDFGDLPETYNTSGNDNPPAHLITPDLKLGASVDAEVDGAPEAMAGQMAGGDDNTAGLVTYGPVGDDENGVTFLTPLIPGSTATIQVTAMNMTGNNAVLQGWIDYNGNGMFDTPAETLVFTNAGGGNVPSPAGLTNANLTFDVPVGAVFAPNGAAFVRFRLSPAGGLFPSSQVAPVPLGEVEDYKVSVGKVGNLVFEDYNFNGLQDAGEPGIAGSTVTLTWLGADGAVGGSGLNADVTYPAVQTGTGAQQGKYYFCGLTDGPGANDNQFKLTFATPTDMTPTRPNQGSQVNGGINDSDGSITGMDLSMAMETFAFTFPTPTAESGTGDNGTTGVGNFPDNVTDETHDQGFAFLDYGDLPTPYKTTMADGGPIHVIVPGLKLGAGVDGEQDATIPDGLATGDDVTGSDDEDGIVFPPLLVLAPGGSFTINVNAMNSTGASAVLQGWIDWNSNGVLELTEALTLPAVPNGGLSNVPVNIVVPPNADFNMCMMYARFRLSPAGGLTPDGPDKFGATPVPQGEVEDHKKPIDIKPPTIICPANIVRNTDLNQCTAVVTYALPMATDDCSSVTLMLTGGLPSGAQFPKGVTMVNWKVTDAVGYMAVCGFTVTVNDMQNPSLTCPANISLPTDLNQCSAAVIYPTPLFSDNCPAPTLALTSGAGTASGSTFSKGTTTVAYKVTDSSGNMSVCNFTVTVTDLQKPNIMCPVSVTKSTDPNLCNAVVTYGAAMATDNCTPPPTVTVIGGLPSGSSFPKGVTTVTLKATDGAGLTRTCTLRVTVNDTQAPALTCPTNIVKSTDADLCTAVTMYTLPAATDNCAPAPAVVRIGGPASGSPFPQGVNTVVLKATDGSGNTKTCTFTVTVNDTQLPDITCPPSVVKNNDLNQCSAVVAYPNPAATDNCHGMPGCPTVSLILLNGLTSNSAFPIGETTVVWKAADASGNTRTCSFNVTVNDTQAPMVMCPNNITVAGSGSPCGFPSANLFPGTVMMENCPNGLTLTSNAPTTLPAGATTITWTAKDAANNVSNCMYVVTVTCTVTPWGKGGVSAREEDGTQTLMGPGLFIAPNPTTGRTVLRLDGVGEKGGELMVMDPLGRIVWRQNVSAWQTEALLDVAEDKLASGVYQVRLRTEQGMVTKGLVVNK